MKTILMLIKKKPLIYAGAGMVIFFFIRSFLRGVRSFFARKRAENFEQENSVDAVAVRKIINNMAESESGWFNTGFSVRWNAFGHYRELLKLSDDGLKYAADYWQYKHANNRPFRGRSLKSQARYGINLSTKKRYAPKVVQRLENLNL